ncbi:MAG: class I SAM-dependent RNA methyltransferase [Gemmatimonadetes bacterium]|nr:class I SAM-dependent RNA methyltransferase [Gemmatimonadota bacterium]
MTARPTFDAFAVTAPGLAPFASAELVALGIAPAATEPAGVSFTTDAAGLAAAQLGLRTVSRVIVRLASFRATAFHELERAARQVDWSTVLPAGAPFALRVTCRKSRLYHSDAVAERVAGAIARRIPGATWQQGVETADEPEETSVDADDPPQLFIVRFDRDRCTISADASGALLHRRGYRLAVGRAPLRETLAAAMLFGADHDPTRPLVDPMCGSGTIAIEAALRARRFAPGLRRRFAAERWPQTDAAAWREARAAATDAMLASAPAPILASDRDAGAIDAARANAERAGVAQDIELRVAPLSALEPPPGPGLLIANPPYGVRVGETKPLRDLFARLGQVARTRCAGWDLVLLSADRGLESQVGLPFTERFATSNGGIPVRLVRTRIPSLG